MTQNLIKDPAQWLAICQDTVRVLQKNQTLVLHSPSWLVMYQQDLHPIDAITQMEGYQRLDVVFAYSKK